MAWEERNGKYYYYRKQRVGKRVVSQYVGSGYLAELAYRLDFLIKVERIKTRWLKEEALNIDREVEEVCKMITALIYSTLLIHGFHTHKGQWRKIRNG